MLIALTRVLGDAIQANVGTRDRCLYSTCHRDLRRSDRAHGKEVICSIEPLLEWADRDELDEPQPSFASAGLLACGRNDAGPDEPQIERPEYENNRDVCDQSLRGVVLEQQEIGRDDKNDQSQHARNDLCPHHSSLLVRPATPIERPAVRPGSC